MAIVCVFAITVTTGWSLLWLNSRDGWRISKAVASRSGVDRHSRSLWRTTVIIVHCSCALFLSRLCFDARSSFLSFTIQRKLSLCSVLLSICSCVVCQRRRVRLYSHNAQSVVTTMEADVMILFLYFLHLLVGSIW